MKQASKLYFTLYGLTVTCKYCEHTYPIQRTMMEIPIIAQIRSNRCRTDLRFEYNLMAASGPVGANENKFVLSYTSATQRGNHTNCFKTIPSLVGQAQKARPGSAQKSCVCVCVGIDFIFIFSEAI